MHYCISASLGCLAGRVQNLESNDCSCCSWRWKRDLPRNRLIACDSPGCPHNVGSTCQNSRFPYFLDAAGLFSSCAFLLLVDWQVLETTKSWQDDCNSLAWYTQRGFNLSKLLVPVVLQTQLDFSPILWLVDWPVLKTIKAEQAYCMSTLRLFNLSGLSSAVLLVPYFALQVSMTLFGRNHFIGLEI